MLLRSPERAEKAHFKAMSGDSDITVFLMERRTGSETNVASGPGKVKECSARRLDLTTKTQRTNRANQSRGAVGGLVRPYKNTSLLMGGSFEAQVVRAAAGGSGEGTIQKLGDVCRVSYSLEVGHGGQRLAVARVYGDYSAVLVEAIALARPRPCHG